MFFASFDEKTFSLNEFLLILNCLKETKIHINNNIPTSQLSIKNYGLPIIDYLSQHILFIRIQSYQNKQQDTES